MDKMDPWKQFRSGATAPPGWIDHPSGSLSKEKIKELEDGGFKIYSGETPQSGQLYTLHWENPLSQHEQFSHISSSYQPPEQGKTCLVLGMDGYTVEVLIDGQTKGVPLWGWEWKPVN